MPSPFVIPITQYQSAQANGKYCVTFTPHFRGKCFWGKTQTTEQSV